MAPPRMVHRGPIEPPIVRRAESERLLDEFGQRIEAIVSWCERIGTMPVLVIPADNESGFEPNRSVLPESVSPEERRSFARRLAGGPLVRVRAGDGHGPIPRADRQAARIRRGPFPPGPAAGAVGALSPRPVCNIAWPGTWTGFPSVARRRSRMPTAAWRRGTAAS